MLRAALAALSPAGPRARLSVLIFHRVLPRPDPLFPEEMDATRFDAVCAWLRAWFNVLPLRDAVRRLADGSLPPRALAITFDDGYADNHDLALPILVRHGLSATFFVATGFLDGGRMWNDTVIESIRGTRRRSLWLHDLPELGLRELDLGHERLQRAAIDTLLARLKHLEPALRSRLVDEVAMRAGVDLPNDLMMCADQVRALHRAGMGIGAHTVTHPILAILDASAARCEIVESKRQLERIVAAPVHLFAYPNGRPDKDYSAESVAIARDAGFEAAVTTARGTSGHRTDPFEIPRFTPWDRQRVRFGLRLALNMRVDGRCAGPAAPLLREPALHR